MLLRSGLGSPTDIAVVREATAALNSIFPATELGTFLALDRKDKERQLAELTSLVTGIRLFNKVRGCFTRVDLFHCEITLMYLPMQKRFRPIDAWLVSQRFNQAIGVTYILRKKNV